MIFLALMLLTLTMLVMAIAIRKRLPFKTVLRCMLAVVMLSLGTTADAQGFFRTWRANRAARIQANMAAMRSPATRSYGTTYTVEGMDCSGGVCRPTTFHYTTTPTVVPGSYRETTTAGFVGSASSHGGTASYAGYSATPTYQSTSNGSDGGGPIYAAASKPTAQRQSATCSCDGNCDCPDCPCRPASKAEVEEDDGVDLLGDASDGASVFAFKPDGASPFAYRPAPSAGAIAGL